MFLGGANYFVSFIDDYSRRCWVYPVKRKADVFLAFKFYKAQVELESGEKIKCSRIDNRGEYTSNEFDEFCKQEGIKKQLATIYTPLQYGVAKFMNKILLERTRETMGAVRLHKKSGQKQSILHVMWSIELH